MVTLTVKTENYQKRLRSYPISFVSTKSGGSFIDYFKNILYFQWFTNKTMKT